MMYPDMTKVSLFVMHSKYHAGTWVYTSYRILWMLHDDWGDGYEGVTEPSQAVTRPPCNFSDVTLLRLLHS